MLQCYSDIYGYKTDTQKYRISIYGVFGQKLSSNLMKVMQLVLNLVIIPWYFEIKKVNDDTES